MMLPAVTACPPKSLTPRRRPAESRPLRELPPAFFCAIASVSSAADGDVSDADARQILTMPQGTAIVLAALLLEDGDLLAASLLHDLCAHHGAGHGRRTDGHAVVATHQEHLFELQAGPSLSGQALDLEHLVLGDPILLAAGFDHCVHLSACVARGKTSPGEKRPVARAGTIPPTPGVSTAFALEDTVDALRACEKSALGRVRVKCHIGIGECRASPLHPADGVDGPGLHRVDEGRVHGDRDHAVAGLAEIPDGNAPRHVEQRKSHAAVTDAVLVQMARADLQPRGRPSVRQPNPLVTHDLLIDTGPRPGVGFLGVGLLPVRGLGHLTVCRQGRISIGVPTSTISQTASMSPSLKAMQPLVQLSWFWTSRR